MEQRVNLDQKLSIKTLVPAAEAAWDAFVLAHPQGTFFHKAAWQQVLREAFGHRTYYLYAERDGQILGLLPLAEIKSFLFGHSLASTPFCVYGGVLALDAAAEQALLDAACDLARQLGVDALEMRNQQSNGRGWPCKKLYYTFRREMSADVEQNLAAIPRKQRAVVRKAIDSGLDARIDDGLEDFYRAYSSSVRNLGTPVFAKQYFRLLQQIFKDECDILTVRYQGKLIASVMSFYYKDTVLPYYGGGTADARDLRGNDFMYWRLMCHAAEKGMRVFDYGRSKEGTGAFSFKKNWGFEPEPLYYEYYLVKADRLPDINPLNPKYQAMIKIWQRLPLGLSQMLGPRVSKYLG